MWRCPTCQSADHLEVVIETWAKLIQPKDDPARFETDLDEASQHDHEWSQNSVMQCVNSECEAQFDTQIAEYFDVGEPEEDDEPESGESLEPISNWGKPMAVFGGGSSTYHVELFPNRAVRYKVDGGPNVWGEGATSWTLMYPALESDLEKFMDGIGWQDASLIREIITGCPF